MQKRGKSRIREHQLNVCWYAGKLYLNVWRSGRWNNPGLLDKKQVSCVGDHLNGLLKKKACCIHCAEEKVVDIIFYRKSKLGLRKWTCCSGLVE
jgi:hypothetical protein